MFFSTAPPGTGNSILPTNLELQVTPLHNLLHPQGDLATPFPNWHLTSQSVNEYPISIPCLIYSIIILFLPPSLPLPCLLSIRELFQA